MRISMPQILAGALIGSILTGVVVSLSQPSNAKAQTSGGVFGAYSLYPSQRKDTEKNNSFIFVNQETGDIWVYIDANPHKHYRFKKIGEPLESVKD